MKTIIWSIILTTSHLIAQEPDSSSALFSLKQAESSFAKMSVLSGWQAAFVEFFAEDAIVFRKEVIKNGKQFYRDQKPYPIVIKWESEFMDISASGDFGFSSGPAEYQEYVPYTPSSAGYYLSVWRKQSNGVWKVVLDVGTSQPDMLQYDIKFNFPANADEPQSFDSNLDLDAIKKDLIETDEQLAKTWSTKPTAETLLKYFAPDGRLMRNGHLPTTNKDSIKQFVNQGLITSNWICLDACVARSGDLAYTYGSFEFTNKKGQNEKGFYVRIWSRRQRLNGWRIATDLFHHR